MAEVAESSWQRVQTMALKLVEALDQLDDTGGLRRLASGWRPANREKAKVVLSGALKAIEAAQAQLRDKP